MSSIENIQLAISRLSDFSKTYDIDSLFIAGSYCRCAHLNDFRGMTSIDVVSSYSNQTIPLGELFATEVMEQEPVVLHDSGSVLINSDIPIKFQSYSPNSWVDNQDIKTWMSVNNIDDVPLMHNIFGRDFTINSLVYSLSKGEFYDPTERAIADFDKELIATLLPSRLSVKNNPIVMLRAIRYAVMYDFSLSDHLEEAIRQNFGLLYETISKERIAEEIVRILKINGEEALKILKDLNMDKLLLDEKVRDFFRKKDR